MTLKAGKGGEDITMRITRKRGKIMEKKGIGKIFPSKDQCKKGNQEWFYPVDVKEGF